VSHSSPSDDDDENEFYDAQDEACSQNTEGNFILKIPLGHRRTSSEVSLGSQVRSDFTIAGTKQWLSSYFIKNIL
jgi:hypothetical protein